MRLMIELDTLKVESEGAVATLTLRRPALGNALNAQAGRDLHEAVAAVANQGDLRVLVLRGEGKAFCVGGDLTEFGAIDDLGPAIDAMVADFHKACAALASLDMPVVAVVHGAVAGAGLALTCLADHVLAASDASFAYAYPGVGFSGDGGVTWLLPRVMGLRAFRDFVAATRPWDASRAAAAGLASQVIDADALEAEADRLVQALANGPTRALGAIRRLALEGLGHGYSDHLAREANEIGRLATQQDAPAAIKAVLSRQAPHFQGL